MNEIWECLDCFHKGDLNINGNCARCNSQAVVSQSGAFALEVKKIIDRSYAHNHKGLDNK